MAEPMNVELDFKSQFYNLQGTHINERKKNFYKLLKSTSPDIPQEQIDIQPRNYQERIFYVDVLIHFKKVDKLIEILKEEIGVLSSRILKQRWFFQEAFKNMSAEDITNNFLPSLSYSLRMKVLKKLALTLSEETMDKIFDLVLERYGLFIAEQFLFSCSPEKIVHVLKNNEITLLPEQLKRLLQKDFNLLKTYFEEYKKNMRRSFDDYDFLNYLAWKHPNLYFELGLNNESSIKLGRRTTRAVIKTNKDNVLEDIKNCWLNKTALVREIKEFDKEYLFLFFPDDLKDINYNSSRLESFVRKYPIKKRWEVFSQAFRQAYNKEIDEHLDNFEEKLAMFFPEKIQQKWAEIKYLDTNDLKYLKYYDANKAFVILKDRINVTSDINQRGRFLKELITVCFNKKDYVTFEEVLKYICKRHRNDDQNVRTDMISHIERNIDYNLITEIHWKYINEIIDIQRVRDECLPFEIMAKYLLFVCKMKLPLEGPVTEYAKDCIKINRSFRLWYELKEPEMEKTILEQIMKILPTIEHEDRNQSTYEIMSNIVDFNKDIKNNKIFKKEFKKLWIDLEECPRIIDLIKQVCTKEEPYDDRDGNLVKSLILYNCLYSEIPLKVSEENRLVDIVKTLGNHEYHNAMMFNVISDVIKKPKRTNFENTLLDYFFTDTTKDYICYLKQSTIEYFAAEEPEVIAKYLSVILTIAVESVYDVLDYGFIRKYSHLGLDQEVIARYKDLVSVNSKCEKKIKLLGALSMIMNTADFLDLVKDYIPDKKKLDLDNAEQKELYQVQCDIAKKCFKNLDDLSILAPVLMHFCQGDYLQSSLGALYKLLYRINEENALSYINVLEKRAMSTRKHAVFLGFEVLPIKDAMTLYSMLSKKETNISAKKYLFRAVLKYFIKMSSGSVLDVVLLNMDFVDKNDTEMIETLVKSVHKVSNKYKPLFVEKVWKFLDVLEQQEVKVIEYRKALLRTVNSYGMNFILKLNKSFCEDLIKKYFLASDNRFLITSDALDYFVINYLLAYLDETHFKFVFNIIKDYKEIHWEANNDNIIYIFRFFTGAYENFDENNVQFSQLFSNYWQHLFSHEQSFTEYIMLRLMILYKENSNIEVFSKEVDKFFQEVAKENGQYIGALLINAIKKFYINIPTKHNTDFNLGNCVFYLLKSNSSELNCFIAFTIVQNFTEAREKKIYEKVVNALNAVNNSTARIYYNILLKKD